MGHLAEYLQVPFRYGTVEQTVPTGRGTMSEWDALEAEFVTTLREQRVEPVPDPIVKMAQRSLDGVTKGEGEDAVTLHSMQLTFDSEAKAAAFAKHMRNAGLHTNPVSSVTVVVDPERGRVQKTEEIRNEAGEVTGVRELVNEAGKPVMVPGPPVNPCKVAWRAGSRRGRTAS